MAAIDTLIESIETDILLTLEMQKEIGSSSWDRKLEVYREFLFRARWHRDNEVKFSPK